MVSTYYLIMMHHLTYMSTYNRLESVDENSLSSRSTIQYSKSQMRVLETKKEKIEKQLHQAQISISQLQEEKKKRNNTYKGVLNHYTCACHSMHGIITVICSSATLADMECSIIRLQKQKEDASVAHANEIACMRDTMRTQFQEEKDQVMNHMRELNNQKQEADAEVSKPQEFALFQYLSSFNCCVKRILAKFVHTIKSN